MNARDGRVQAEELVREHITTPALLSHSHAVEAVMRALAERLGQDAQRWGLAGLLHDIDYETTAQTPERHGAAGADMLSMLGFDEEITHAVLSHGQTGEPRTSLMDRALFAADPATGLLTACAYVQPSKKLAAVALPSVLKKFKSKAFAAGADRDQIDTCAELGLSREEFLEIALKAMQAVAGELGL